MEIDKFVIRKLTLDNIQKVHQLFENNSPFFSIPLDYFRRGTLEDDGFDTDLSLILFESKNNEPIAAFIVVKRNEINESYCFFKGCVVDEHYRRQGLGIKMFSEFLRRAKKKAIIQVNYGPSVPEFWQPGVDIRDTSLYFFLRKMGFKSHKPVFNLTVSLDNIKNKPTSKKKRYLFERVKPADFDNTFNFVKQNFPEGTWAEEVNISFRLNPPTTFIAKNAENEIIGWSTHSLYFPGSFGPTGVLESIRGKGIGTVLFLWSLWDLKQNGSEICEIMWVNINVAKFYSKVGGAYISPIFYPMYKKIK